MADRAIGFIRRDFSGSSTDRRILDVKHYAAAVRADLVKMLITPVGEERAALALTQAIRAHDADIVIVPALVYVASFKRGVTELAALHTTSGETWERGHRWPDLSQPAIPAFGG